MTRSFSSLCITNAICLATLWIFIGLGMHVTKMQKDQDILDLYGKCSLNFENGTMSFTCEEDEIHLSNGGTNESLKMMKDEKDDLYDYLPFQSLTTISKSFFWLACIMAHIVCFTEFIVVWLKVQAVPCYFVFLFVAQMTYHSFLTYTMSTIYWFGTGEWVVITIVSLCRILLAKFMCCMYKELYNEVDGILNNPVVYAVGPTGQQAMAGA